MKKIMIVEDEASIRGMVRYALERNGFELIEAEDARQAHSLLTENQPDLILMDLMLPGQSGLDLTMQLRRNIKTRHLPIIMLTAVAGEQDKITGLDSGADDYVGKPFSPRELIARINAVLRRHSGQEVSTGEVLVFDQLKLDAGSHRVTLEGEELPLGPTEFRLLKFFMEHPERVYSREQMLNRVWGENIYVEERTVDVHILRLRKSLRNYDRFIQTVRGTGYRFSAAVALDA
ncbi:MAG: phosphate regulon transcriptional regulator PhoB [Thiolinea sp.]